MDCDFCSQPLDVERAPANVALLNHLGNARECREQFRHMVDNLNASWPAWSSGG